LARRLDVWHPACKSFGRWLPFCPIRGWEVWNPVQGSKDEKQRRDLIRPYSCPTYARSVFARQVPACVHIGTCAGWWVLSTTHRATVQHAPVFILDWYFLFTYPLVLFRCLISQYLALFFLAPLPPRFLGPLLFSSLPVARSRVCSALARLRWTYVAGRWLRAFRSDRFHYSHAVKILESILLLFNYWKVCCECAHLFFFCLE